MEYFRNILSSDFKNLVKNHTEPMIKLILEDYFEDESLVWFATLRDKDITSVSFLDQHPAQATTYPAVSFVLETEQTNLSEQSFSCDENELDSTHAQTLSEIANAVKDQSGQAADFRVWLSDKSIFIGCHTKNKKETLWLSSTIDFLIKLNNNRFLMDGYLEMSHTQTELRVRPELYPPDHFTRIFRVTFKKEKAVASISDLRAPFGHLDGTFTLP